MSMEYEHEFIPPRRRARARGCRCCSTCVDTYASETNKTAGVWSELTDAQLEFRPHAAQQLGAPDPGASDPLRAPVLRRVHRAGRSRRSRRLLPPGDAPGVAAYVERLVALRRAEARAAGRGGRGVLARRGAVLRRRARERIWIFWRRVLHTAHHRTQLTVYLRMLNKPVPPTYGPTADVSWTGADPDDDPGRGAPARGHNAAAAAGIPLHGLARGSTWLNSRGRISSP